MSTARGKPAEATKWLEQSMAANPGAVWPVLRVIDNYLVKGQQERGLTLARKPHAANPGNPGAREMLDKAQLVVDKPVDALESFSQLTKVPPEQAAPLYWLAKAQAAAKNEAGAMRSLKKALAPTPEFVEKSSSPKRCSSICLPATSIPPPPIEGGRSLLRQL